ncbi:MAG TPA: membrane protein insertion efficiency factor YidD [Candidatus Nanopelagicaceae bacterium]|nr:membrane protein insertion efficiency factor YidD [Candidatus Nanopelagicaceae bacterium]
MSVQGILKRILLLPIEFYQKWISPGLAPRCRYYPSCSSYAVTAISRFGPIRGTGLAVWRLVRCNPWSSGGVDYVPEVPSKHSLTQGRT